MNEGKKIAETPLMKQYFGVKAQHPDALLLFRVGDFYETFGQDAIVASKVLGIVLTKRANGSGTYIELAGFPHHSIETYLPKLVRSGYKVAVCDQLEDPKLTKKIVKRGVTELVTPGIAYNEQLLNQKENNFLATLCFSKDKAGVSFLDISTGAFKVAEGSLEYIEMLLSTFSPKEVVMERSFISGFKERFSGDNYYISPMDEWAFVFTSCEDKLKKQFGIRSLKGFGIESLSLGITAAGAMLFYLEQNQAANIGHVKSVSRIDKEEFVWLDRFTIRNLELFAAASGKEGTSLLDVIDKTLSPLGARLLRRWLSMPLKSVEQIRERHMVVESFVNNASQLASVRDILANVGDLERITARAAVGKIMPREVVQLKRGLSAVAPIKEMAAGSGCKEFENIAAAVADLSALLGVIGRTIKSDPASQFGKGDIIADGVSEELDSLRNIARHGKEYLLGIQQRESERTGIPSLKINYNSVFGYYLEVRNTHKDKVPEDWIRKQTLVSAERYITQELKEYEEKIMGAEERIYHIEQEIYKELVDRIRDNVVQIQQTADAVAQIDVLSAFATLALENNYCRPSINNSLSIKIEQGRHPVIETLMAVDEEYVANDLYLDNEKQQIIILTGPNMAGKSALLRQTALIVLLAQIGSFVPAKSAEIGVTDKIFTRVGASDNISRGESTFMVEMIESATILHNLSERSLILLDEIGRGTSTFDGMSIAWAIVEYIHECGKGAKTLFATHYHELNELENVYKRVKNYHVAVKEIDNRVIFLRKLLPGGVAHSFGIHVARLAGMPEAVILSAQRKLRHLEQEGYTEQKRGQDVERRGPAPEDNLQLTLYQLDDPLLLDIKERLKALDLNNMSPLNAFDALRELKRLIGER